MVEAIDPKKGSPINDLLRTVGRVQGWYGDEGCWSPVLTAATQRAHALTLYPAGDQERIAREIEEVLSGISGNHDFEVAAQLLQELERIVPLSR